MMLRALSPVLTVRTQSKDNLVSLSQDRLPVTNSELRPLRPSQRLGLYLCHVKDPGTDGQWAQEDEVARQTPASPSHPT